MDQRNYDCSSSKISFRSRQTERSVHGQLASRQIETRKYKTVISRIKLFRIAEYMLSKLEKNGKNHNIYRFFFNIHLALEARFTECHQVWDFRTIEMIYFCYQTRRMCRLSARDLMVRGLLKEMCICEIVREDSSQYINQSFTHITLMLLLKIWGVFSS